MLLNVFLIFCFWRFFDFFVIILASKFISYLGFFPYKEILSAYHLPDFITKLTNFDGIHYLLISEKGYSQYEQAFFPLYPLLIKFFTFFTYNYLLSGLIISNFFFFFGLIFLIKYLKLISTNFNQFQLILTILFFPTSFYFGAIYTEGLFFFLFWTTLYFLKKEKYFLSSIFAFLASLTRLIGIFLIVPIGLLLIEKLRKKTKISITQLINYLIAFASPFIGLIFYSFYLWQTTGDPLMFFHAQPAFGANRSTNLIFLPQVFWRYLKIFFTASINFQYFISLLEFFIFLFVFIILLLDIKNLISIKNLKLKIKNYDLLGLNIFSFVNILLPTLTGTFSSIPRYSLLSISCFIYLANIKNRFLKILIWAIFLIFHIIFLGFFSQGYFIS